MTLNFTIDDFDDYEFEEESFNAPAIQNLISQNNFDSDKAVFGLVGCGGTISSAYAPALENIQATHYSPTKDILHDLSKSFGIAEDNISFASLLNKDSRDIKIEDMKFILDFLNGLKNERIVLTCGTYGLPLFTAIIDRHVNTPHKIIGITGSILISAMREHDVDFNSGGAISAANAIHKFKAGTSKSTLVFANFHGNIYTAEEARNLDIHPKSHNDSKFYRGQRMVRKST